MARVLIVDDDAQFRRVVRLALAIRGYDVSEAANGREGVEQLQAHAPDLVLLDWQMPVMDGQETCRRIRAVSRVPIIVVSAADRREEALANGLSGCLAKPVDIDALLESIGFALCLDKRA